MAEEKNTTCESKEQDIEQKNEPVDKQAEKAPKTDKKEKTSKTEKKEKVLKKNTEIEQLKKELEKKSDLLLRTAAEFDNFKKRTEREKSGIAEYAKAGVIKQLLPIIDNVDRSSAVDTNSPEYLKGIEMIIKQFNKLTESLNIVEIAKTGDKFDPNLHEAVMHIEDENFEENTIAEVLQKGYKIGDTVIRTAMVKVAN